MQVRLLPLAAKELSLYVNLHHQEEGADTDLIFCKVSQGASSPCPTSVY